MSRTLILKVASRNLLIVSCLFYIVLQCKNALSLLDRSTDLNRFNPNLNDL